MKYSLRHAEALIALAAGAFAMGVSAAGPQPRRADPADASAPVPPTRYESSDLTSAASGATPPPPQNWKALNQVVASYDSMSLTMDMSEVTPAEGTSPGSSAAVPASGTPPALVSDHSAPQPVGPDPHAHHQPKAVK